MKRSTRSPSNAADTHAHVDVKPTSALMAKLDAYDPMLHGTPSPSPEADDGSDYSPSGTPSPSPKKRKTGGGGGGSGSGGTPKKLKIPQSSPKKPPRTPTKSKAAASAASASGSGSSSSSGSPGANGLTPKAHYALPIWEAGVKSLNKSDVASETGLSAGQQNDMTRRDKGSLRKAFDGFVGAL